MNVDVKKKKKKKKSELKSLFLYDNYLTRFHVMNCGEFANRETRVFVGLYDTRNVRV